MQMADDATEGGGVELDDDREEIIDTREQGPGLPPLSRPPPEDATYRPASRGTRVR